MTRQHAGTALHLQGRRLPRCRSAFSLLEMMVVVGIISIILSVLLMVGRSALNTAKVSDTRALLTSVNTAILAFADENPYKSLKAVQNRYGPYPPDELMAFDPCSGTGDMEQINLMPGGIGGFVKVMAFPINDDHTDPDTYVDYGDIKALVWSLKSRSRTAAMFEAISGRFKASARFGADAGDEFFDTDDGCYADCGNYSDSCFDPGLDREVQYLVDGWGNPLVYHAIREKDADPTPHSWVARKLVQANKNLPVVMSYGPDGEAQRQDHKTFEHAYTDHEVAPGDALFNDLYNDDNIYLDEQLRDRLAIIVKP